ncbi:MAG: hypothetical protein JXR03_06540 [Cyclobacteriaceae bacterium]
MDENREQTSDQEYLRAFNLGYELQKALGDKVNKGFDNALVRQLGRTLDKVDAKSERMQAIKAGQKQYLKQRELEKRKADKTKTKERDHDRER